MTITLSAMARANFASKSEAEKDIEIKRIIFRDELDRKFCLAKVDHATWRAGLSESALLIYADSVHALANAKRTRRMNPPSR